MTAGLFTSVEVAPMGCSFGLEDGVVTLGSCFADAIGTRLEEGGFRVERNPFGTLYNPLSLAEALERIVDCREITSDDLVQHDGLFHSWHHHGSFSRPTVEECLAVCNSRIRQAHSALREARVLMLTFGTAYVFSLTSDSAEEGNGMVVANCHKLPPRHFARRRISVEEIVGRWQPLLQKLITYNSELITILTVSPIRHMADGAHGNQVSKATLLLAVEELVSIFNSQFPISYFPAYEIVLDELRDYRFYGPDLSHPSALAEDIVYDRFQRAAMTPATIQQAHNNAKQAKRRRHIPLRVDVLAQ